MLDAVSVPVWGKARKLQSGIINLQAFTSIKFTLRKSKGGKKEKKGKKRSLHNDRLYSYTSLSICFSIISM